MQTVIQMLAMFWFIGGICVMFWGAWCLTVIMHILSDIAERMDKPCNPQ